MSGPCDWGLSYAECSDTAALDGLSDGDKDLVESMAVDYLWAWTGRRFGLCTYSIRPSLTDCLVSGLNTFWGTSGPHGGGQRVPGIAYAAELVRLDVGEYTVRLSATRVSQWSEFTCGRCAGPCACTEASRTYVLPGPVHDITAIVVDGEVLDPSAYRVDNRQILVRVDGQGWPVRQDLGAAITEANTWEVTYTVGEPVPAGGKVAAGLLASEFAKAMCNDNTCRLPQRLQSITRQGVTMAVLDSFEDLSKGRTGIWLIDSWVASVSESTERVSAQVYSPDIPRTRMRRITWPTIAP